MKGGPWLVHSTVAEFSISYMYQWETTFFGSMKTCEIYIHGQQTVAKAKKHVSQVNHDTMITC